MPPRLTTQYTGDTKYMLFVQQVITEADLDVYSQAARNQAGVRVLDVGTLRSYPLSAVTSADNLTASQDDLATYYAQNVNSPTAETDSVTCVKRAQEDYDAAVKLTNELYANCLKQVALVLLACEAICAVTGIVGTPIAGMICIGGCLINAGISLMRCNDDYATRLAAAAAALRLALERCGVYVA